MDTVNIDCFCRMLRWVVQRTVYPFGILVAQDPDTLETGIEGLGRARASSDGCLFESSRLEEDVPPGQEVPLHGKTYENLI